jgi:ABC-type sugar transport system ATPase subunit
LTPSQIELAGVSKAYASVSAALVALDLQIAQGERLVVLGPSGSGKTTLLRLIAGLEMPDHGTIRIAGQEMRGVPPHRRDVAMVFQNPALYPHLNVFENLTFGLKARGMSRSERQRRVDAVADLLGLIRLLGRRPAELSGGECQRVALGRAVAREPKVLLLDEPFSGLDDPLRAALRGELLELHRRFGSTLVHVTHDQGEALCIAERMAVLDRGRLMQCDSPRQIYDQPAHRFVASFVGNPGMSIIPCQVAREDTTLRIDPAGDKFEETWRIPLAASPFQQLSHGQSRRVELGIRVEAVRLTEPSTRVNDRESFRPVSVVIRRLEYLGGNTLAELTLGQHSICAWLPASSLLNQGDRTRAFIDFAGASWFDPETGLRLSVHQRTDNAGPAPHL